MPRILSELNNPAMSTETETEMVLTNMVLTTISKAETPYPFNAQYTTPLLSFPSALTAASILHLNRAPVRMKVAEIVRIQASCSVGQLVGEHSVGSFVPCFVDDFVKKGSIHLVFYACLLYTSDAADES